MNDMSGKMSARRRAIRRRNIFLACCALVIIALLALIVFIISAIAKKVKPRQESSTPSDSQVSSENVSSEETGPEYVQRGNYTLDANYTRLLLVNGSNPLPGESDESLLVDMDDSYRQKGYDLKKFDKDAYPYLQAMCEAAWAENIPLKVCSPYRSYSIQKMLFDNRVKKEMSNGLSAEEADAKTATIIARPGTSEHQTGLAADFICSNDSFEGMPAFTWMQQHAAEYGFILRFPKDKQDKTGVIYESWHYRFVGINEAQKIKASGLCLEEYLEQKSEK